MSPFDGRQGTNGMVMSPQDSEFSICSSRVSSHRRRRTRHSNCLEGHSSLTHVGSTPESPLLENISTVVVDVADVLRRYKKAMSLEKGRACWKGLDLVASHYAELGQKVIGVIPERHARWLPPEIKKAMSDVIFAPQGLSGELLATVASAESSCQFLSNRDSQLFAAGTSTRQVCFAFSSRGRFFCLPKSSQAQARRSTLQHDADDVASRTNIPELVQFDSPAAVPRPAEMEVLEEFDIGTDEEMGEVCIQKEEKELVSWQWWAGKCWRVEPGGVWRAANGSTWQPGSYQDAEEVASTVCSSKARCDSIAQHTLDFSVPFVGRREDLALYLEELSEKLKELDVDVLSCIPRWHQKSKRWSLRSLKVYGPNQVLHDLSKGITSICLADSKQPLDFVLIDANAECYRQRSVGGHRRISVGAQSHRRRRSIEQGHRRRNRGVEETCSAMSSVC